MPRYLTAVVVHLSSDKSTLLFLSAISSQFSYCQLHFWFAKDESLKWRCHLGGILWASCHYDKVLFKNGHSGCFPLDTTPQEKFERFPGVFGAPCPPMVAHSLRRFKAGRRRMLFCFCVRRFVVGGEFASPSPALLTTKTRKLPGAGFINTIAPLRPKPAFIVSQTIQNSQYTGT